MRFHLLAGLALTAMVPAMVVAQDGLDHLPMISEVAPDAIQISPHVPNMGEHWALPPNLPGGPIYCVIDGRVVCVEYMFDHADLEMGESWVGLAPGIETPAINHINVEYLPNGIEPHPVPLYQVHIFFAGHDVLGHN